MQFNVQKQEAEDLPFLFEWINAYRAGEGKAVPIYTMIQLQQDSTMQQILCKIDQTIFTEFNTMDSQQKVDSLEKYLEKSLGKRMKWSFKQKLGDLSEQSHTWELFKLLCFLAINSPPKNQFINQILSLGECSQAGLMRLMRRMSANLENITEIREIIEHIEDLQEQNQDLRSKLMQMAKINNKLLALVKDLEQENKQSKATVQNLRDQKIRVFKLLGVDYIEDYVDIFRKIKLENQKLEQFSDEMETKFKVSESIRSELEEKLRQQYSVIDNLEDEISKLKAEISDNQACWSPSTKINILKSANSNKQNLSKCSTSLNKSLFTGAEWTKVVDMDDQNNEKVSIFNHNQINMQNLQEMYLKYSTLNDHNILLTDRNKKLSETNAKLRKLLRQISDSNKQYEFVLHASEIEAKIVMDKYMCRVNMAKNQ